MGDDVDADDGSSVAVFILLSSTIVKEMKVLPTRVANPIVVWNVESGMS